MQSSSYKSDSGIPAAQDNVIAEAQVASALEKAKQDPILRRLLHKVRMKGAAQRKFYLARREKAKIARNRRRRVFMARRGKRKGE